MDVLALAARPNWRQRRCDFIQGAQEGDPQPAAARIHCSASCGVVRTRSGYYPCTEVRPYAAGSCEILL